MSLAVGDVSGYGWSRRNQRVDVEVKSTKDRQTYYGALDYLTKRFVVHEFSAGNQDNTDAPKEWQGLFKSFVEELGQWADLNTEHLRILASKTETIENLARSCERLGNTLELLQVVSQELISQLKTSINL